MKQVFLSKNQKRTVYIVHECDHAGTVLSVIYFDCATSEGMVDQVTYIVLTDRDGNVREEPFYYLNVIRRYRVDSTRRMMAQAIQEYETFCDIYEFDRRNLPVVGYELFKRFLFRTDMKYLDGSDAKLNSVSHVSGTISMVKMYLKFMGYSTNAFENSTMTRIESVPAGGHLQTVTVPAGDRELAGNPQARLHVPEHLNPEQMKKLFGMLREEGNLCYTLICNLGFGYGLRRGEILGLTTEDIEERTDQETGEIRHFIVIRNRTTDRRDAHAKTLRKPKRKEAYESRDFKNSIFNIAISDKTYKLIMEYYNTSRNVTKEELKEIDKVTSADSVFGKDNNHYIFIGHSRGESKDPTGNTRKLGWNLLSGTMVNRTLEALYRRAGFTLRNRSHALRHSYAMYLAYYAENPLPIEKVKLLMRHANVSSTQVYFNLPDEEINRLSMLHSVDIEKILED